MENRRTSQRFCWCIVKMYHCINQWDVKFQTWVLAKWNWFWHWFWTDIEFDNVFLLFLMPLTPEVPEASNYSSHSQKTQSSYLSLKFGSFQNYAWIYPASDWSRQPSNQMISGETFLQRWFIENYSCVGITNQITPWVYRQ